MPSPPSRISMPHSLILYQIMRNYKYPCKRYYKRLNADYIWLAMFILRLTSTQTNWYVMSFLSPALMYNWTLPANHSSWWTHSAQADSRNINIENLLNRLNWSLLPLQKSLQQLQIFQLRCCIFDEMPNNSISSGLVTVGMVRNYWAAEEFTRNL